MRLARLPHGHGLLPGHLRLSGLVTEGGAADGPVWADVPESLAADVPGLDETRCVDSGSSYFIRVRRIAGVAPACDPFVIQVSNGVFST